MNTSLWSSVLSFASPLWDSSADSAACTHNEFSPMWVGADRAGAAWVPPRLSNFDKKNVADARTPEPLVAEHLDSTTLIWNALRLLMACSTFQTFVRAIDEDELLIAQMRAEARSRLGSDSDSQPYFLRTRCYGPALGRFLRRDP